VESRGEIHKDLLLRTSSELNEMSTLNVFVTRPGPEANLSFFLEIKTDLFLYLQEYYKIRLCV